MANAMLDIQEAHEERVVQFAERPITFARFLELAQGCWLELVDGVVVEKPIVQLDHERCSRWLYQVMGGFVQEMGLGEMLSSRIMVQTDDFGGRMPDLLFVRQERLAIVQQKAVYGAPDLIIEIVSPNDRPSDLRALEADYHRLGVPELLFIHLRKQELHHLHRTEADYQATLLTTGQVTFATLDGLSLAVEHILREPRPSVRATLNALFAAPDSAP
jgi:Uma2 family endonuclease